MIARAVGGGLRLASPAASQRDHIGPHWLRASAPPLGAAVPVRILVDYASFKVFSIDLARSSIAA